MIFKTIDILSPNITFYFKSNKSHTSIIGGLLTLLLFICLVLLIIKYVIYNPLPNKNSLNIFRNFEINYNSIFFNETDSRIFHFFWISNDNNLENEEYIKFKSVKNKIIRIYMINVLNAYEYNSSDLHNYDHWVYDTCNNYVIEDDQKYDYDYSFCIQYYYNSIHKKYYSINDNVNFKWPFFKEIQSISENSFFSIFIEQCSNNTILNSIFGECYSEEKIKKYLDIFNHIFISFTDNKFEINQKNPIRTYSRQIHNNLSSGKKYFSYHQLQFMQFNYEESGFFHSKIKENSFMFEEDRISKVYNLENNKILASFSFHFKNYINEFRKQENHFFLIFRIIANNILSTYFIFYLINLFFNSMVQTSNFISFLDDKDSLIHRHINYDISKLLSIRSNMLGSESNENNNQFNSLQSNNNELIKKNLSSNFFASYNRDNISKFNKKSEIIDIGEREKNFSKTSENIVFIDNGTFMDDKLAHNKELNLDINNFEKIKSLNLDERQNKFNDIEYRYQIFSPRKKKNKEHSKKNLMINNLDNRSLRNNTLDKSSKLKIADNSSISLLNAINNTKNLYINNSNFNIYSKKEVIPSNNDRKLSIYIPNNNETNKVVKNLSKEKEREKEKEFTEEIIKNNYKKISTSSKANVNEVNKKAKNRLSISLIKIHKKQRKSYQIKLDQGKDKDIERSSHNHHNKNATTSNYPSKGRNTIFVGNKYSNDMLYDTNSQISISKKLKEHHKKNNQINKLFMNKLPENEDYHHRRRKTEVQNSLNVLYTQRNESNKFIGLEKYELTIKTLLNYLCLYRKNENNMVKMMYNFRKKLLSEEYFYIMQLSLIIYKRKFGCKSNLDKKNLIEELYYDY